MSSHPSLHHFMVAFAAVLLPVGTGCAHGPELVEGEDLLILEGATLIDGTGAGPRPASAVVIEGPRILRVGELGDFRYPEHATVVDLAGRWLVPGFMDLHAHIRPGLQRHVFSTLLAFGITTIRNPAAEPSFGVELRENVSSGALMGPRIFTAGSALDTDPQRGRVRAGTALEVDTEADVRHEMQRQAAMGVDYVKLYRGLPPELVTAAIDEAHAHQLKVVGHLGTTSWTTAARLGIDALVHSAPLVGLLPLGGVRWRGRVAGEITQTVQPGELAPYFRHWRETLGERGSKVDALIAALVASRVEVNPTLVMTETLAFSDDPRTVERLEPSFAPEAQAAAWRTEPHPYTRRWTADDFQEVQAAFPTTLELIRQLHERGVLLTTGSDLGNPWITPGVSLHREMWLLHQAGIPALEVLTIATRNGAEALGILDEVGTIETGKRADLVILGADPLDDIQNTRAIEAVYLGGDRITGGTER